MKRSLLVCAFIALLVLSGCASTGTSAGNQSDNTGKTQEVQETKNDAKFFDENSSIPTPESICECQYASRMSTTANDNITYRYKADDLDALVQDYKEAIVNYGLSTKDEANGNVSIIENDVIVAEIYVEDGKMNIVLIDKAARISAVSKEMAIGDYLELKDYEFTLNDVEFTYEVLPTDTHSVYSSYPADSGKVYLDIVANIKNTMQRDIRISELPTAIVTYDGKYQYRSFTAVDTGNSFDWVDSYIAATPLETVKVHFIVECPEEVSSSGKSVLVEMTMGNEVYQYEMR